MLISCQMYVRLIPDSAREVSPIWVILSRFTSHLSSTIFTTIFSALSPSIPHRLGWWWRRSCWSRCSFHRLRLLAGATGSRASESCTNSPLPHLLHYLRINSFRCHLWHWQHLHLKALPEKSAEVVWWRLEKWHKMTQIYPTFLGTKQSDVSTENPHQVLNKAWRSTPQAWM